MLPEIRKPPYCFDRRHEWLQDDPWAGGAWCWVRGEETRAFDWPVPWWGEPGIFEVPDGVLTEHADKPTRQQVNTSTSEHGTLFG